MTPVYKLVLRLIWKEKSQDLGGNQTHKTVTEVHKLMPINCLLCEPIESDFVYDVHTVFAVMSINIIYFHIETKFSGSIQS